MNPETAIIIAVVIVAMIALLSVVGSLYRKVGPNRALIVYGRGGTKVVVGGGTVVLPMFQKADIFNLELMSFDVAPDFSLYTNQGVPVTIEAITQLKVENDENMIKRAANQFLSRTEGERETMVRQVMEGHLRGIVGQLTVEQLVKDPELVSARMRDTVAADLDKLGLEVVSFTLKDVSDESGYIANMSRPEIARNKQMAEIAEAEMQRNVAMKQASTNRESAEALAEADQQRVLSQNLSKAAQAEAQRDLSVKEAQAAEIVARQKAQADRAYDIQSSIIQQKAVEEQSKVQIIQKQQQVKVEQVEGERRAAELLATVQRQAEADSERIRILAEAERRRIEIEAEGKARSRKLDSEAEAAAILARAQADASAITMRGLAEAETIKAKGLAEADALQHRVEVLNVQNDAALLDKALSGLPEIAGKLFEAYGKIGSVTYVASGDGEGVTSKITRDVVGMVPMLGAVFESTTGMNIRELLTRKHANGHDAANGASMPIEGEAQPAVVVRANSETAAPEAVTVVGTGSVNGATER